MENKFIIRISNGDPKALEDLYMSYEKKMLGFIRKKNPSFSADDIQQVFHDTLLAFKNNVESGRLTELKQASLYTFLCDIAYKRAINLYKKKKAINNKEISKENLPNTFSPPETDDRRDVIAKILKSIGEECQKILELFYYKGYESDAIGNALGIKPATARKQKERCIQKIRDNYSKQLA